MGNADLDYIRFYCQILLISRLETGGTLTFIILYKLQRKKKSNLVINLLFLGQLDHNVQDGKLSS